MELFLERLNLYIFLQYYEIDDIDSSFMTGFYGGDKKPTNLTSPISQSTFESMLAEHIQVSNAYNNNIKLNYNCTNECLSFFKHI